MAAGELAFASVLPPGAAARVPAEASAPMLADADRLLRGEWETLGLVGTDMEGPDWLHDPVTGRRSAPERYAFRWTTAGRRRTATSSRSGRSPGCST